MILAVSSFNENNSKIGMAKSTNYNFVNVTNTKSPLADRFISSKQQTPIAFTGNFTKVGKIGKTLLGDEGAKLGGKVRRFAEEATQAIGSTFRKLTGGNELLITEKPVIACGYVTGDYPNNTINFLKQLSDVGIDPGTVGIDSVGGISSTYKSGIEKIIKTAAENGDITTKKATDLINDMNNFTGHSDLHGIASNININDISIDDLSSKIGDFGEHAIGAIKNGAGDFIDLAQDGAEHLITGAKTLGEHVFDNIGDAIDFLKDFLL